MEVVQGIMQEWYVILSQVSVALSLPLKQMADWAQLPLLTVFLFGLIGAMSPCQLTTNLSAMAYVSRRVDRLEPWSEALAYTLGKVLVYTLTGGVVIFLGLQLQQAAIPVAAVSRKIVGPLMIVVGLGLMGLVRLRGSLGRSFARWLQSRLPQTGFSGAFLLGVVFSFTFCPTLFWLFFGLMIPLALITSGGWIFPALFAVGTAFPLLAFAGLLSAGTEMGGTWIERLRRSQRRITQISGAIFILLGINDTLTYWFI